MSGATDKASFDYMRVIDWSLAIGTIAYGLYEQTWWIVAMGVLGLGMAWYNPASRVRGWIGSKMTTRRKLDRPLSPLHVSEEEIEAEMQAIQTQLRGAMGGPASPASAADALPLLHNFYSLYKSTRARYF